MVSFTFSAGDQIALRLAQEEIQGIALESSDSEIVLLKLASGYNIGILKENILGVKILKKYTEEKVKEFSLAQKNKDLPSIGLVVTGGTIAAKLNPKKGGVSWLTDVNEFSRFYPELFSVANVKTAVIPFMISSEAMTVTHWTAIAEAIQPMLDDPEIKGIVVTHGTDFLHYTAAALSFFLRNLNKPVVLTYSQKSIDRASSDARLNLQCAVRMALSNCAEVSLVGHASSNDDYCLALRGTKVRKLHTSRRDAFQPVNCEPIAHVFPDHVDFVSSYTPSHGGKATIDTSFSDKIALVKFYPGQTSDILDFYALKYKGVVIEVSGLGHLPPSEADNNWIPAIKKHVKNGFVICAAAQTVNGRLDPYVYSNGRELVDAGVIFLEDMLAETAFVKLGWVLGHYGWKKNTSAKMLENFAGELNPRLNFS